MPYEIVHDTAACPAEKPWAVKTEGTGNVHGCHATEAEAKEQLKALYMHTENSKTGDNGSGEHDRSPEREHRYWR